MRLLVSFLVLYYIFMSNSFALEIKILNRSDNPKYQNDLAITIDMCPSTREANRSLFNYLERLGKKLHQPLPVAISLSGNWITNHKKELAEIRKMYLAITWVNHSYSHPVENDFCNSQTVNFTREVGANLLLFQKYGLKISQFFRFPGLRCNQERLRELNKLGFIALGADAWLAKGQKIKGGSIVLVHGNGNEPQGDWELISYLEKHQPEILTHRLQIVPVQVFLN